jgi:methionyl-tRNA formyltransferase
MSMRIVFMGTPDFAVASLEKIIESGQNVKAVVTAPDRPAGRGQKLMPSAVKEAAMKHNIPVLQPEKLKSEEFINELKNINADLFVVVAFRMLPEIVWNLPKFGTINLHGSLLPQYRGAAPINWAIINGEKETGVTTFFITHEIDTGNILEHRKISIAEKDNAGTIHDQLMIVGAELLAETIGKIERNEIKAQPQEIFIGKKELKHAPKIFRETCKIDWNNSTEKIYNLIRGLSPYPAAYSDLSEEGKQWVSIKIFETEKSEGVTRNADFTSSEKNKHKSPGSIETDGKTYLRVYTNDGSLSILSLQYPGKKRLSIEEFLKGNKMPERAIFI